ncbi:isochorismatase family cysteine hydrolase [Lysobacter sp. LF1]|uniref:Isochorismatase family cysteine hydrolase n=1 Tax=Lysobacter stagni TaxID=3045172 RepID=A0ABT6XKZ6_9GAMM|nr:isochorismatase family cysteine hydrolase [Lysobacter sp. LF1]MDI9240713.1 isochorismatase family cysteine hydrolase [Lysobacter sp. LF1]
MPAKPPALLIVDMMNLFEFEDAASLAFAAVRCASVIERLRTRFDRAGAPVVYINDNFAHWQGEFRDLVAQCISTQGPPAEIARKLAPRSSDFHILKPKHSAFLATPLTVLLAKLRTQRLVITGIAADSCILATAQDAHMREFGLWVPGDAVAAQTSERKARALALMAQTLGADVRGERSVRGLFPR